MDTIPNPIIITDGINLIKCNEEFFNFFSYKSIKQFNQYNKNIANLFVQHDDYFSLALIDKNTSWIDYIFNNDKETIVSILNKDGEPRIFELTINELKTNKNNYVIVFTDITAIQNEKKLLKEMAYNDPLTNIYNRQMFNKILSRERENKKRHGDALSLIMLDIDHFKAVNDTYGHDVGDKVLITLTKLITKNLRTNDVFARWGGEEFMILLPRTDTNVAYDKAQELRQLIEQYSDDVIPGITVSFGITEILNTDQDLSCFKRVDKALYDAKINRNDVVKI